MEYTSTRWLSMGLRMLVIRTCDTIPIPGTMAMYTSGCPKNQNRCCHKRVDPPEWGCNWSLITRLDATKKLVPATWSRMSRMHAGMRTENEVSAMQEVMNQAHVG